MKNSAKYLKSPVVLLDMDDTVCDLTGSWTQILNERFGTKIKRNDLTDWNLKISIDRRFPGVIPEEEIWRPLREPGLFANLPFIKGARAGLTKMKELGWRVVIVTSLPSVEHCPGLVVQEKYDWIEMNIGDLIRPRDVVLTHEKYLVNGNILIDDSPTHINAFPNGVVIMDAPWNQDIQAGPQRIRVNDWTKMIDACERLLLVQSTLDR